MSIVEKNVDVADDKFIDIHIRDIVAFLRRNLRYLSIGFLVGSLIGALYTLSKPNEYKSQITLMPEIQNRGANLGGLGSLAGLAGVDLSSITSANDAIRPDLYPTVVQSVSYMLYMSKQLVISQDSRKLTIEEFLLNTSQSKLNWPIINHLNVNKEDHLLNDTNVPRRNGVTQLTKKQESTLKELQSRVGVVFDKKTGIITIEATMTDPVVAAEVAQYTMNYLVNYVTNYRTQKARKQVEFLEKQVKLAKKRYENSEYALSIYRDRNRGLATNTARIEEQRIQAEFMLAQSIYNDLSKQLEFARIKIQEDTPVFKPLETAIVPREKSGPKRTLSTIGFGVAGVVFMLTYSLYKLWRLKTGL